MEDTMLGGLGIVLAVIIFFVWRKSAKSWQRTIAWLGLIWVIVSFVFLIFLGMNS
jgi:formate-dependent nitrite reductase membrane component NrfD